MTLNRGVRFFGRLTVLACVFVVAGCESLATRTGSPTLTEPDLKAVPSGMEWWAANVKMGFDGASKVRWHLDALLAEQVFGPVLDRHRATIELWRFHRRAAPDQTGHRFSLLFYTDVATAEQVSSELSTSPVLNELVQAGDVKQLVLPVDNDRKGSDLGAVSDKSWAPAIQKTWPWFIMGVSQHWLALIREIKATAKPPISAAKTHAARDDVYRAINDEVDAQWFRHGQHAYLHHLNAVFGYKPLLLQERRTARF